MREPTSITPVVLQAPAPGVAQALGYHDKSTTRIATTSRLRGRVRAAGGLLDTSLPDPAGLGERDLTHEPLRGALPWLPREGAFRHRAARPLCPVGPQPTQ
ncbi:hypothetical protein [Streptomyces kebangsaanensis]|uniref:hypothetical protein n=1 Tax=Streptomyces kebangsaanensis TaxID=864058 RepID=UPI00093A1518|nr:hypothetical protein [Streptomyces kebangsaanensis]